MKFWDSSALVPLVSKEAGSARLQRLLSRDPGVTVWAFSPVEVHSALVRRRRAQELGAIELKEARQRIRDLAQGWSVVVSLDAVIQRAMRMLDVHELRAADALQLAAALTACDDDVTRLPIVCLDDRLGVAAEREGFTVISD